ncbi:HD domain-containing phosphohydrolase [Kallotenue papyrolyticum]|uniref:HD domain-containing phosphohydrolase n=1 Tax=Kallotenue papyrolyticum TaxID=1325125 RepID=UPI00049283AC|nr:HD domain-containing phosphohydrolase [Kallotenue papyrolyticum]
MSSELFHTALIAILDDQPTNTQVLEQLLRKHGYTNIVAYHDPRRFLADAIRLQPEVILLDLHMPHLDGIEVLRHLARLWSEMPFLPVIVLTADVTNAARRQALEHGARDFISKPFDMIEVVLRVRNVIEMGRLYQALRHHNQELEARVQERTQALEAAQIELLECLARAAEYRDDDTGEHTQRVGALTAAIAMALGLPAGDVELLRRAAPLHDIGKIGIPDAILLKSSALTAEEFELIKTHTLIGADILGWSRFSLLQVAAEIALAHHERWDGSGYPHGLVGSAIPLAGRIVAVADVFDALTHERPYKSAWSEAQALAEIERQRGRQFDPAVVDAFFRARADAASGAAPPAAPESYRPAA